MSGDHNMHQKPRSYLDDFECPRCGHCCKAEWVGLTDEQVEDDWERITGHSILGGDRSKGRAMHISPDEVFEFSRAIEAKLKERNT